MQTNDNTLIDNVIAHKRCNKCERELPLTGFYKNKSKPDGHQGECKECSSRWYRSYYQNNKESISDQGKRYYQDNKEAYSEWARQWRQKNKVKVAKSKREWRQANPDKRREHNRNRRARERGSGDNITASEWQSVLDRFNGKCAKCGSSENIHMDHVVPLAKGGRHDVSNVQPLCQTCNLRKGVNIEDYRGKFYKPAALPLEDAA